MSPIGSTRVSLKSGRQFERGARIESELAAMVDASQSRQGQQDATIKFLTGSRDNGPINESLNIRTPRPHSRSEIEVPQRIHVLSI
jgi:hypothetical protein